MTRQYYKAEVIELEAHGWGVKVTATFLDRGADYNGHLVSRSIQFMTGVNGQPSVGQRLKLTIEESD